MTNIEIAGSSPRISYDIVWSEFHLGKIISAVKVETKSTILKTAILEPPHPHSNISSLKRRSFATLPVGPEAAAALADARNREAVGRLVSRVLRPRAGPSPLAQAIAELKADARAAGLTDTDIDAELAVYNAERRDRSIVD
jgi:hypothetical protein